MTRQLKKAADGMHTEDAADDAWHFISAFALISFFTSLLRKQPCPTFILILNLMSCLGIIWESQRDLREKLDE